MTFNENLLNSNVFINDPIILSSPSKPISKFEHHKEIIINSN